MNRAIFLALCCLASACSTIDRSRPTMEADPAELGGEGLIYQNELRAAYVRYADSEQLCPRIEPSFQEADKWSYRRYGATGRGSASELFKCMRFAAVKSGPEGVAQIARHIQAGLALSDLYCRNYFSRIALHSRKRGFWRTSTNDVGTAISAILGLASAGIKETAGIGVGFGLADGFFRNYDESFLVGPDLAAVQKAVFAEQTTIRTAILGSMPTNFADANMAIKRHADACSYIGMKLLINQKVTSGATDSREALVNYMADYQITQADIDKAVEAKIAARKDAEEAAEEAKAAEEAARKVAEEKKVEPPQPESTSTPS